MENFFFSLKIERFARETYRTRDQARADMFDCIERFYNRRADTRPCAISAPLISKNSLIYRKLVSARPGAGRRRWISRAAPRNLHCVVVDHTSDGLETNRHLRNDQPELTLMFPGRRSPAGALPVKGLMSPECDCRGLMLRAPDAIKWRLDHSAAGRLQPRPRHRSFIVGRTASGT